MKERFLTCIICPRGCALRVELDESGAPTRVEGNACPRGEDYAVTECTSPMRTVTTTVRCEDGKIVPVKTNKPVPKGSVIAVMAEINRIAPKSGLPIGAVILMGVAGTDADVVVSGCGA